MQETASYVSVAGSLALSTLTVVHVGPAASHEDAQCSLAARPNFHTGCPFATFCNLEAMWVPASVGGPVVMRAGARGGHTGGTRGTHMGHTWGTHGALQNMSMRVLRVTRHSKAFLPVVCLCSNLQCPMCAPCVSHVCPLCVPCVSRVASLWD